MFTFGHVFDLFIAQVMWFMFLHGDGIIIQIIGGLGDLDHGQHIAHRVHTRAAPVLRDWGGSTIRQQSALDPAIASTTRLTLVGRQRRPRGLATCSKKRRAALDGEERETMTRPCSIGA